MARHLSPLVVQVHRHKVVLHDIPQKGGTGHTAHGLRLSTSRHLDTDHRWAPARCALCGLRPLGSLVLTPLLLLLLRLRLRLAWLPGAADSDN